MICGKAEYFADWQAALLKLCNLSNACTYEEQQDIERFAESIQGIRNWTGR